MKYTCTYLCQLYIVSIFFTMNLNHHVFVFIRLRVRTICSRGCCLHRGMQTVRVQKPTFSYISLFLPFPPPLLLFWLVFILAFYSTNLTAVQIHEPSVFTNDCDSRNALKNLHMSDLRSSVFMLLSHKTWLSFSTGKMYS